MSPLRQFAIRKELLYSGFVLPNVQIFFVDGWLRMGLLLPLGNFADISYLVEN